LTLGYEIFFVLTAYKATDRFYMDLCYIWK
jgi:hypothetical protein